MKHQNCHYRITKNCTKLQKFHTWRHSPDPICKIDKTCSLKRKLWHHHDIAISLPGRNLHKYWKEQLLQGSIFQRNILYITNDSRKGFLINECRIFPYKERVNINLPFIVVCDTAAFVAAFYEFILKGMFVLYVNLGSSLRIWWAVLWCVSRSNYHEKDTYT